MTLAYLPSPAHAVWHVSPLVVRVSALIALAAIATAAKLTSRRWTARGGRPEDVLDIAIWAGAFTLVGGRLAQVLNHPLRYLGHGASPLRVLYLWDGRIGFWGAMAFGALGTWIGCRRRKVALADFADTLAPGLVLALGIGCWGSYFDQQSFGRPTDAPWAVSIDPTHRPASTSNVAFYQPTFLFESVCDIGIALLLLWIDRRWQPHRGSLFAIYLACFTATREGVNRLRTDHASHIAGLGLDDWGALLAFFGALVFLGSRLARTTATTARGTGGSAADQADSRIGAVKRSTAPALGTDAQDAQHLSK